MSQMENDMCPAYPMLGGEHAHTVFLNFEGADLTPTMLGDARHDASDLLRAAASFPALSSSSFGGDDATVRGDIAEKVDQLFSAYDLRVVTTRPTDTDDYVMVMVGGLPGAIGAPASARGFAPLDCRDGNPHDIVFVFAEALAQDFPGDRVGARSVVAAVIAQETAHSYGLVHTDNTVDVMFPYVESPGRNQRFDSGYIVGLSCSNDRYQDSAKRMMQVLGARK